MRGLLVDPYLPVILIIVVLVLPNCENHRSKQNQLLHKWAVNNKKTYIFYWEIKKLNSKRFKKNQLLRKSWFYRMLDTLVSGVLVVYQLPNLVSQWWFILNDLLGLAEMRAKREVSCLPEWLLPQQIQNLPENIHLAVDFWGKTTRYGANADACFSV